jgi:hypothetical protein
MTKLKTRHFTEAARPQLRTIVAGLLICVVWITFAAINSH